MWRREGSAKRFRSAMVPWCSGLAYVPVKDEIAGSNPVGTAFIELVSVSNGAVVDLGRTLMTFPPRIWMISNVDHTIRRRDSAEAVANAAGMSCASRVAPRILYSSADVRRRRAATAFVASNPRRTFQEVDPRPDVGSLALRRAPTRHSHQERRPGCALRSSGDRQISLDPRKDW